MSEINNFFDINTVLMSVFSSLETIRDEKNIELIYDIEATIPKEFHGDSEALSHLLTQMLTFVFQNSNMKEIVLSLSAPEDFLYEESISFEIKETDLSKEKIASFLETRLSKNIELLDGESIYEDENPSGIHINIPFKLNELGKRRYYRLPYIAMLGKKVLLICESPKKAQSIQKMFKYFLYDVDISFDEYKKRGSDLGQYDILVIEDKLITEEFENLITKVQEDLSLKYVVLYDSNYVEDNNTHKKSACLIKPVMQESIFELIISLFEDDIKYRRMKPKENKTIVHMEKYIDAAFKKGEVYFAEKRKNKINQNTVNKNMLQSIKKEKETKRMLLDIKTGESNVKRVGMEYPKELNKFLDSFDRSDLYFRDIVKEKAIWKIKEFSIDLEKQAKLIGAQKMSYFADGIKLLFVYDKLDTLPIYPGKYHMELKELIAEIKTYLDSSKR